MKNVFNTLVACGLCMDHSVAVAENYASVNYLAGKYEESGIENLSSGMLSVTLGTEISENLSVEGRYAFGISDDSTSFEDEDLGNIDTEFELARYYGVYARFGAPVGDLKPYALVGYSDVKVDLTFTATEFGGASGSESDSDSDVSYGVGADLAINDRIDANVEYLRLYDNDGAEVSGISLGLRSAF